MWKEYFNLLTDPAHILFELTLIIVIDVIIVGILWGKIVPKIIKRHDERYHPDHEHPE